MITFQEQNKNFNYVFGFTPKTGESAWQLTFGSQIGHISQYDNLFLSGYISGDFNQSFSLEQNNEYLAIGDPYSEVVNTYENFSYTTSDTDNKYDKRAQLFGAGVTNVSGFGSSLSLNEDFLFVGAPNSNNHSGAVFLYTQYINNQVGTTSQIEWGQTKFVEGHEPSGYFGCRIKSIKNINQFVTAISATGEKSGEGSVYLYQQNLITLLNKLELNENDVTLFGKSLYFTLVDNIRYLAVGYDQGGTGKVKMYKESEPNLLDFTEYRTLQSDNPSSGDMFGYSIDGNGTDYIIFGCPNENNSGAAYYYKFNSNSGFFKNMQRIVPTDLASGDYFGKNVSFDNNDGIITSNNSSGKGYVYYNNNDTWEHVATVSGNNANSGSFGGSINGSFNTSLYHNLLMVGSYNETGTYIYTTGAENFEILTGFCLSGNNGKLYDNDGNFLYGYNANKFYEVHGQVHENDSNLFINDHLYNSKISRNTGVINAWDFSGGENLKEYYLKIYDVKN